MPTPAYSSYGTQVRISDGVTFGSYPIIAATTTAPIIVTTGVPHNIIDVSHGTVTGVLPANQGANGSWLLERVNATQLKLHNAVGVAAYGSGGALTPSGQFASIAELRDVQDAGAETTVVDVAATTVRDIAVSCRSSRPRNACGCFSTWCLAIRRMTR